MHFSSRLGTWTNATLIGLIVASSTATGCSSESSTEPPVEVDAGTDVTADSSPDSASDARRDITTDSAADTPQDVTTDTPADVTMDSAADAPNDVALDSAADAPNDVALDSVTDTPTDTPLDTAQDAPLDAAADAGHMVYGVPSQSCKGLAGNECQGESCCASLPLPAGTFLQGRSTNGNDAFPTGQDDEQPERSATLSAFSLDKYEVTVARFRQFVNAYDGTPPSAGAGAHPQIAGSGWQTAWNDKLPQDRAALSHALACEQTKHTWTDTPSGGESFPINCVNWYVAFAFCAWDGGRLPTEAEWEYAAAGGAENRLYPWGSQTPDKTLANYNDNQGPTPFIAVGSYPTGAGRWGHLDLAGNMFEWVVDTYDATCYSSGACHNWANLTPGPRRSLRGGCWFFAARSMRAADRADTIPRTNMPITGVRCAR